MSKRSERNNRKLRTDGPSRSSKQMLAILSILVTQGRYRMYEGTASPKAVARRRARNRVARISRRANR